MPSDPDLRWQRLLPFDHDYRHIGEVGDLHNPAHPPNPPTFTELREAGLIAPVDDPDRYFSVAELATATWLRAHNLDVVSVNTRSGIRARTPDAVIAGVPATLETKGAVGTVNSIAQRIRSGRGQSRRVVVDLRDSDANLALARIGLEIAVRRYGSWVDEVLVIVPVGSGSVGVGWWYGRNLRSV